MGTVYRFNRGQRRNQMTMIILWFTVIVTLVQMFDETGQVEGALRLFLPDVWRGEYWRLLSVTLVHGGPFHIFMNGYSLWVMGSMLEPVLGRRNLAVLYIASGLGGSIAIVLFGDLLMPVVGASGAIFGLFGATLAFLYSRAGSISGVFQSPLGFNLIILLAINIGISFLPGISAEGHFGGLAVGLLAGYLYGRAYGNGLAPVEKLGALFLALLVIGLAIYSFFPLHRGAYHLIKAGEAINWRATVPEFVPPDQIEYKWEVIDTSRAPDFKTARDHLARTQFDVDKSKDYLTMRGILERHLFPEKREEVQPRAVPEQPRPSPNIAPQPPAAAPPTSSS